MEYPCLNSVADWFPASCRVDVLSRNWKNHKFSTDDILLPVLPNLESVVSMEDTIARGTCSWISFAFLYTCQTYLQHYRNTVYLMLPRSKIRWASHWGNPWYRFIWIHFFSTNYLSWWRQFWIKHVLPILRHKKIGGWKQIWNENSHKFQRSCITNGESFMYFNFHKEIPKITRVIGAQSWNFVSVTVLKAGLVQLSHVKSSLVNHNRMPTDRGGYVVSITVIQKSF